MYEVEVKVRADHDAVRERLAELDARFLGTVVQADTYFDAPHRNFAETDEALRIRRVERLDDESRGSRGVESTLSPNAESRLTYKGPLVDSASKTREEVELVVADGQAMDAVLSNLGFEPVATVRKTRDRYELDGYVVTLDSVADLGEFVEVEIEADEANIDRAREGVLDVLERLGLDPEASIRTSYLGLLLGSK